MENQKLRPSAYTSVFHRGWRSEVDMELFFDLVSGVGIAALSSWITVKLSLSKFRSERLWDKKVLAYEKVIDALHKVKAIYVEHLDAEYIGKSVSSDREKELNSIAKIAREEILKATDIGAFMLSKNALDTLKEYENKSKGTYGQNTWFEHLDSSIHMADKCLNNIIGEAKRDLKT